MRINNTLSSKKHIEIGTPLGGRISPILFLGLLIDIKEQMEKYESFFQFEDDINLLVVSDSEEEVEYKLQKLTRKIIHYLHENKLALNYDKFQLKN